MRTVTTDQLRALSNLRRAATVRVDIEDATATLVDMTTFLGLNWINTVQRQWSVDSNGMSATVEFRREQFGISINPFRPSAKANADGTLIQLGREVVIFTSIVGMDAGAPVDAELIEVFRGDISKRRGGNGLMTLECRGQWGALQDAFIEEQRTYPAVTPTDLEDAMQEILDDFAPGITLFFPDGTGGTPRPQGGATDPAAVVSKMWKQGKMGTMEALSRLAQQIGWTVTYRFNDNTGQFELTFYEPSRTKVTPDFTFSKDSYLTDPQTGDTFENVRNVVEITFGRDQIIRSRVTVSDVASIAEFGRRAMAIAEDASSQLDTQTEAEEFANAILDDLAQPDVEIQVNVPLFWPAEPGVDLYRLEANETDFDTDQDLGLVSITDTWSQTDGVTTLTLRGKPAAGISRWLAMEARPAVAPEPDHFEDIAPTGLRLLDFISTIIVIIDDPRVADPPIPDWALTRVYLVDEFDPGFPDFTPSAANLVAEGKAIRFEITDLLPNITYSVKVEFVDLSGNVSGITAFEQETTLRVAPFFENLDGQQDQLLRNNDFGQNTLDITTIPPDQWFVPATGETGATWASFIDTDTSRVFFTEDAARTESGGRALQMSALSSFESALIPFQSDDIVAAKSRVDVTVPPPSFVLLDVFVKQYDSTRALLRTDDETFNPFTLPAGFQDLVVTPFKAFTDTRFITVGMNTSSSAGSLRLTIDRLMLQRGYARQQRRRITSQAIAIGGTAIRYNISATSSVGNAYDALVTGVETITFPGSYVIVAGAELSAPQNFTLEIQVDEQGGAGFVTVASETANTIVSVQTAVFLDFGWDVRVLATPQSAGRSVLGTTVTRYHSQQVDRREI